MCAKGVVSHELSGDFLSQFGLKTSFNVDCRKLLLFSRFVRSKFCHLAFKIRSLGIRLRTYRHILACGHRHSASHKARDSRYQHVFVCGVGGGHPNDEARDRHDSVVRP